MQFHFIAPLHPFGSLSRRTNSPDNLWCFSTHLIANLNRHLSINSKWPSYPAAATLQITSGWNAVVWRCRSIQRLCCKNPAADRKSLIFWVCATCLDTAITRPLASALIARVIKQMGNPNIVPRIALWIERLVINRAQGVFFHSIWVRGHRSYAVRGRWFKWLAKVLVSSAKGSFGL